MKEIRSARRSPLGTRSRVRGRPPVAPREACEKPADATHARRRRQRPPGGPLAPHGRGRLARGGRGRPHPKPAPNPLVRPLPALPRRRRPGEAPAGVHPLGLAVGARPAGVGGVREAARRGRGHQEPRPHGAAPGPPPQAAGARGSEGSRARPGRRSACSPGRLAGRAPAGACLALFRSPPGPPSVVTPREPNPPLARSPLRRASTRPSPSWPSRCSRRRASSCSEYTRTLAWWSLRCAAPFGQAAREPRAQRRRGGKGRRGLRPGGG